MQLLCKPRSTPWHWTHCRVQGLHRQLEQALKFFFRFQGLDTSSADLAAIDLRACPEGSLPGCKAQWRSKCLNYEMDLPKLIEAVEAALGELATKAAAAGSGGWFGRRRLEERIQKEVTAFAKLGWN